MSVKDIVKKREADKEREEKAKKKEAEKRVAEELKQQGLKWIKSFSAGCFNLESSEARVAEYVDTGGHYVAKPPIGSCMGSEHIVWTEEMREFVASLEEKFGIDIQLKAQTKDVSRDIDWPQDEVTGAFVIVTLKKD